MLLNHKQKHFRKKNMSCARFYLETTRFNTKNVKKFSFNTIWLSNKVIKIKPFHLFILSEYRTNQMFYSN